MAEGVPPVPTGGLRRDGGGDAVIEGVPTSRIVEANVRRRPAPDRPAAFVHERVVGVAAQQEVVEIDPATARRMRHVVRLQPPCPPATRKPAPSVAVEKGPR